MFNRYHLICLITKNSSQCTLLSTSKIFAPVCFVRFFLGGGGIYGKWNNYKVNAMLILRA